MLAYRPGHSQTLRAQHAISPCGGVSLEFEIDSNHTGKVALEVDKKKKQHAASLYESVHSGCGGSSPVLHLPVAAVF